MHMFIRAVVYSEYSLIVATGPIWKQTVNCFQSRRRTVGTKRKAGSQPTVGLKQVKLDGERSVQTGTLVKTDSWLSSALFGYLQGTHTHTHGTCTHVNVRPASQTLTLRYSTPETTPPPSSPTCPSTPGLTFMPATLCQKSPNDWQFNSGLSARHQTAHLSFRRPRWVNSEYRPRPSLDWIFPSQDNSRPGHICQIENYYAVTRAVHQRVSSRNVR